VAEQGVTIRFGGGDILRADRASGAGLVLEYDGLLEDRFERGVERTGASPVSGVAFSSTPSVPVRSGGAPSAAT